MGRPSVLGRLFTAWILTWLALAADAAAPLSEAHDLAADAAIMRDKHLPLMVMFSRANCGWCDKARQHLLPIAAEPLARVLLRQVDIDREEPLTDFTGETTTHRTFSAAHQVKLAPTLIIFGPDGERLVDPLVGYQSPDFYGALIDRAIEESHNRMRSRGQ